MPWPVACLANSGAPDHFVSKHPSIEESQLLTVCWLAGPLLQPTTEALMLWRRCCPLHLDEHLDNEDPGDSSRSLGGVHLQRSGVRARLVSMQASFVFVNLTYPGTASKTVSKVHSKYRVGMSNPADDVPTPVFGRVRACVCRLLDAVISTVGMHRIKLRLKGVAGRAVERSP
jgi:hypothetical protein